MPPRNRLRFQCGAAYRLKRNFGQPIDIYRQDSEGYNLATGAKVVTKSKCTVLRAVLLPGRSTRDFTFKLAYLVANKDFTYGGLFDRTLRDVLIDRKDLTGEFQTLLLSDYLVINHRRYQIKEIDEAEIATMYWLVISETKGAPVFEVQNLTIYDTLTLHDSVKRPTTHAVDDTLVFAEGVTTS